MSATLQGSVAWNTGSITDNEEAATDVTVTGAVLGDFVQVSSSLDVEDLILTGQVTAANVVTVTLSNFTGGGVDILTPTIYVLVTSASGVN